MTTTATREIIAKARDIAGQLHDLWGSTEEVKTLIYSVALLEKYVELSDRATVVMSAASDEIRSLRTQLDRVRQGAAPIDSNDSETENNHE